MEAVSVNCLDILEFQDAIQKMRQIDDKIIYVLNTAIPTESFKSQVDPRRKCEELFHDIETGHAQRDLAIKRCLDATKERVKELKKRRDDGEEDPVLVKNLRKEQNALRLLQSELNVEEVVRNRTLQVYLDKCRSFYKPSNRNL